MKKIFILSAQFIKHMVIIYLLLLMAASCKKSNSNPYYMKTVINDTAVTFNYGTLYGTDSSASGYNVTIDGFTNSSNSQGNIDIDITGLTKKFSTGVYTDTSSAYSIVATFSPQTDLLIFYQAGSILYLNYGSSSLFTNHFILNITSITTQSLTGTFSGDFYLDGSINFGGDKHVISGSFFAKKR